MYMLGRLATIYAAQILFGLIATNRALPTTHQVHGQTGEFRIDTFIGHNNATLLRFANGILWSPSTPTSQAAVAYSVPDTSIILNFTRFGPRIPVVRAISIIHEARQQVQSHLASKSENVTKSDNFTYITPVTHDDTRVCAVFAQAHGALGLSWVQIDHILDGLMQFTNGAGVDGQLHYQALQFEISFSNKKRVGGGLLSCIPVRDLDAAERPRIAHSSASVQGRDTTLNLISKPVNETILDPPHESSLPSSPLTQVSFPIFGSDLSLTFIWLGSPLPSDKVNAAFDAAFLKIAPLLIASPDEPIPRRTFISMSTSGKYQIAIQVYGMIDLTWAQTNSIVIGLWRFTNGIGTVHERQSFRNLSFHITDEKGIVVGYGNLLSVSNNNNNNAITSASTHKKRSTSPSTINTINSSSSISSIHPSSQIQQGQTPLPYIWPVHGTPFTLIFSYMGHGLPASEVSAALRVALQRIQPAIRMIPDEPIPPAGFENHIGVVQVAVTAYEGAELSWWQLGQILDGLQTFCTVRYKRLLVFEIEAENVGRLGAGRVWGYDGRDVGRGVDVVSE